MPNYPTLQTADLSGKRVFLRAGFDLGIENGQITDISRVTALVPTMRFILDHGGSLVIGSHEGRPKGKPDPAFSQKPIVPVLEKALGTAVSFAPSPSGPETTAMAKAQQPGQVLLLENLRYDPREEKNDESFAKELAELADVYVNDAFTNCHRNHASMVALARLLPAYMGLQLEQEVSHLSTVTENPRRPLTLIISGAKMETKVPIVEYFLTKGDDILLGGAIANTFIAAQGFDVASSKHEPEFIEKAKEILRESEKPGVAKIHVPRDAVMSSSFEGKADAVDQTLEDIEEDMSIYDIGSATTQQYIQVIAKSALVVWNGPLGLYETEQFSHATRAVAEALAAATKNGTISIVGGGDTIDFHTRYGVPMDGYTFVSTGGGAMLEFVSGKKLPALEALQR